MSAALTAARDLFSFAKTGTDREILRAKFLACYEEIEAGKDPFAAFVAAAFDGLDVRHRSVALFRAAAVEIAERVDNGADGTGENAYHNAFHFAKVVANFNALTAQHNLLHPDETLSDKEIAGGLLAAAAHDICHNGRGNSVDGRHKQFRLEQLAIDTALDWAHPENGRERTLFFEALSSIYATDVSSSGTDLSPALFVRNMYEARGDAALPATAYSEFLCRVFSSRRKIIAAALLQDSDVFSSLIDEKAHLRENARVGAEMEKATGRPPSPAGSLWFLATLLQGRTTTDAARRLTDAFMAAQIAKLSPA